MRPFVNVDGCDPHRWWSLGTGVVVDDGTGRRSKRRDDERADEHQALPPTTGAANASVSERRGCRNACGAGRRRCACGPNKTPNFPRIQRVALNVSAPGAGETPYIANRCSRSSDAAPCGAATSLTGTELRALTLDPVWLRYPYDTGKQCAATMLRGHGKSRMGTIIWYPAPLAATAPGMDKMPLRFCLRHCHATNTRHASETTNGVRKCWPSLDIQAQIL